MSPTTSHPSRGKGSMSVTSVQIKSGWKSLVYPSPSRKAPQHDRSRFWRKFASCVLPNDAGAASSARKSSLIRRATLPKFGRSPSN